MRVLSSALISQARSSTALFSAAIAPATAIENRVSLLEIVGTPTDILRHSLFIGGTLRKSMSLSGEKSAALLNHIKGVLDPIDVVVLVILTLTYKPIMRGIYRLMAGVRPEKPYQDSFLGYMQKGVASGIFLLPILYILDVLSALMNVLGITSGRITKLPLLINTVGAGYVYGTTAIQFKDYLLQQRFRKYFLQFFQLQDRDRERTINELINVFLWSAVSLVCLEALSYDFGFRLRSLLALGGIGSASFVLALKGTFENFAAGVLLKLQDKFRLNETISIKKDEEGTVTKIDYLNTVLRRTDGSEITIPNSVFNTVQVINWSRTPYRLFKANTVLPASRVAQLELFIDTLREKLAAIGKIETASREMVIAASGLKDGKITLDLTMHLNASTDVEEAELRTLAIKVIAEQTSLFSTTP